VHQLLQGLLTRRNVEQLGFLDADRVEGLLGKAFGEEQDASAMRFAFNAAQWVVLAQRFDVARAEPPFRQGERWTKKKVEMRGPVPSGVAVEA
jgi:hypothetical protein